MTEPSEAAMKVWREAMMAYHAADTSTMAEDIAIADEAAALVIDRAISEGHLRLADELRSFRTIIEGIGA